MNGTATAVTSEVKQYFLCLSMSICDFLTFTTKKEDCGLSLFVFGFYSLWEKSKGTKFLFSPRKIAYRHALPQSTNWKAQASIFFLRQEFHFFTSSLAKTVLPTSKSKVLPLSICLCRKRKNSNFITSVRKKWAGMFMQTWALKTPRKFSTPILVCFGFCSSSR